MTYAEIVEILNTARTNRDKFQVNVLSLIIGEIQRFTPDTSEAVIKRALKVVNDGINSRIAANYNKFDYDLAVRERAFIDSIFPVVVLEPLTTQKCVDIATSVINNIHSTQGSVSMKDMKTVMSSIKDILATDGINFDGAMVSATVRSLLQ